MHIPQSLVHLTCFHTRNTTSFSGASSGAHRIHLKHKFYRNNYKIFTQLIIQKLKHARIWTFLSPNNKRAETLHPLAWAFFIYVDGWQFQRFKRNQQSMPKIITELRENLNKLKLGDLSLKYFFGKGRPLMWLILNIAMWRAGSSSEDIG